MAKTTPIKLDKFRNLRYGMAALSLIEDQLDKSMAEIDFAKLRQKDLAVVIWAGLYHEDKDLTPEKIMDLVDEYSDIQTIADSLNKAIEESFGKNA